MIPQLFSGVKGKSKIGNGLGFFTHCTQCDITEERNGAYYLELTTLVDDILAQNIKPNMWIKVIPNREDPPQYFEIYSVDITDNEIVVKANHIKFLLLQNGLGNKNINDFNEGIKEPSTITGTPQKIINTIKDDCIFDFEMQFDTDITKTATFDESAFWNRRLGDLMSGTEGGLLDLFGGEYHYNNQNITLYKKRGCTTRQIIRYGVNLCQNTLSMSNDECYSHVVGFADVNQMGLDLAAQEYKTSKPKKIHSLPQKIITLYRGYPKINFVDCTDYLINHWNGTSLYGNYDEPTIGPRAQNYKEIIDILGAGVKAYVKAQSKTSDYTIGFDITDDEELDELQSLNLCDTVVVLLSDGTTIASKITEVTFNALTEKYKKIRVGEKPIAISNFLTKRRR